MAKAGKPAQQYAPPERHDAPHAGALAVGAGVLVYALVFYLLPVDELGGQSRAAALWQCLLVPENFATWWFGDPRQFALMDRLSVLAVAAVVWCVCGLAGWLLVGLARIDRGLAPLETVFFSCCVGFSAVSLYTLAVGLLGRLHERWVLVLPAAAVMAGAAYRAWRIGMRAGGLRATWRQGAQRDPFFRWLWCAVPFAAAILLGGTLPPIDFDVREYHLQVPKEFYLAGKIDFLPHNVYGNMPLGAEMLSLTAMAATGDWWRGALVGKTMIASCALLTALGLFTAGRRFFGPAAGAVAALVFISIPWVARISAAGLIDGVAALYLWAAAYAVLLWSDAEKIEGGAGSKLLRDEGGQDARPPEGPSRLPWALLAGFLAGSAVACKYPGAVFVLLPLGLFVVVRSLSSRTASGGRRSLVARFAPGIVFALAAALACGPWLAKNWALTGNPVYPLLYEVFDGRTRTAELDAQWRRAHDPEGYGPHALGKAILDFAVRSTWQSVLVLPLAVLGLLANRRRPIVIGLAVYTVYVLAAWWLLTHRIDRFWVPVLPVLAFLAGLSAMVPARREARLALGVFLLAGMAGNWVLIAAGGADDAYFVSTDRLRTDPQRVDPWHVDLNEHIARDAIVLAVGDAAVFDLEMPVLYNTVFDANLFESLMTGRSPEERRRELADRNVGYIYVHWGEIARYRSPGNYGFSDYVTPGLFDTLVSQQVLDPPLTPIKGHPGQVFPVHGIARPPSR